MSMVSRQERKIAFGLPKVKYSCRFLATLIVAILVIYNVAEFNIFVCIQLYV